MKLFAALVLLAALAAVSADVCNCGVYCNGVNYYRTVSVKNSTSGDCDTNSCTMATCYYTALDIFNQNCYGAACNFNDASCPELTPYCISSMAIGIIVAIAIGALVVVFCIPIAICFCIGAACFAGRRKETVVYTSVPGYGTA
eukprot:m.351627 g.351627  ORF g.351627 m.351627 type:complete len:143 (-) comp16297_c0_seq1:3668-4096(-)